MVRVAINGFGRIGRMVLRAGIKDKDIEFVAINDLSGTDVLSHLLKYDSVHGKFDGNIEVHEHSLTVNHHKIKTFQEKDPAMLPWRDLDVDVVVESTGFFLTKELASKHLYAGAKKVILSAPAKEEGIKTIVMGVNEHDITKDDDIISNASCTTNCLAPLIKVLNDNYGIVHGFMTTVHSYTGDQKMVDAPHKDLRRARSGAVSIIPTSTGAAKAVGRVIPEMQGKLDGFAMRVPTPDGSITDVSVLVEKNVSVQEVNELFKNVASHHLKEILEYVDEDIVSADIIGNPHSSIFDSKLTKVIDGNLIKVVSWYDNEYGYSNRMVDMIKLVHK